MMILAIHPAMAPKMIHKMKFISTSEKDLNSGWSTLLGGRYVPLIVRNENKKGLLRLYSMLYNTTECKEFHLYEALLPPSETKNRGQDSCKKRGGQQTNKHARCLAVFMIQPAFSHRNRRSSRNSELGIELFGWFLSSLSDIFFAFRDDFRTIVVCVHLGKFR